MKTFNICTPEEYTKGQEKKTKWHQVGHLRILDDEKMFLQLNLIPNQTFVCFEEKFEEKK